MVAERNKLASKVKREIIKVRRQMALQQGERLLSDDDLNATVDTVSDVDADDEQTKTADVDVEADVLPVKEEKPVTEKPSSVAPKSAKKKGSSSTKKPPPAKSREPAGAGGRCTRRSLRLERSENSDVIEIDDDDVKAREAEQTIKSEECDVVSPRRALTRARVRPSRNSARTASVKVEDQSEEVCESQHEETESVAEEKSKESNKQQRERSESGSPPPAKRLRRQSEPSGAEEEEPKQEKEESQNSQEDSAEATSEATQKSEPAADELETKSSEAAKSNEEKSRKSRSWRGTPSPRKKRKSSTSGEKPVIINTTIVLRDRILFYFLQFLSVLCVEALRQRCEAMFQFRLW